MASKNILLVDDEKIILDTFSYELEQNNYDVATAPNGLEAVARLQEEQYDLVVTDLMMPELDGIQVLKKAKKVTPETPVIILTGYGDLTSAIDALRLGADDYLLKPCDLDELLLRIARCLEKQDLLAQLKDQNRKLENEIIKRQEAEKALQKSSEKIKLFAYSVAHDLKNPAIALHGLTKLLTKRFKPLLPQKGLDICEQILKSSKQIAELVEKINIFISTSKSPLTIEPVNLNEIIKTIREEFAWQLDARQIRWVEPDNLPVIKADRVALLRVLRNFVDNGLKYSGDDLSEIEIGYKESAESHVLFVRDDGVGLNQKESKGIFGLFKREKTSTGITGTGLGLAIVREIAEQHQGEVWTRPGLDKGITFYTSLSKSITE